MSPRYRQQDYGDLLASYDRLLAALRADTSVLGKWLVADGWPLLPKLEPVLLAIERAPLARTDIGSQVQQLAQLDGWLRRRSGLFMTLAAPPVRNFGSEQSDGLPLAGEWTAGRGVGLSLALDQHAWTLTTFTEHTDRPKKRKKSVGPVEVLPALAQSVTTTGLQGWRMNYRVYWGADNDEDVDSQPGSSIRRLFAAIGLVRPRQAAHLPSSSMRRLCAAFAGFSYDSQ